MIFIFLNFFLALVISECAQKVVIAEECGTSLPSFYEFVPSSLLFSPSPSPSLSFSFFFFFLLIYIIFFSFNRGDSFFYSQTIATIPQLQKGLVIEATENATIYFPADFDEQLAYVSRYLWEEYVYIVFFLYGH